MVIGKKEATKAVQEARGLQDMIREEVGNWVAEHSQGALAEALGKSDAWVSQALNPWADTQFAAHHIPVLRRLCGDRFVLRLVEGMGYIPIPSPLVDALAASPAGYGRVTKEIGDLLSRIGKALEDGRISQEEYREIHREGSEAVVAILAFMMAAKQVSGSTRKAG